MPPTRSPDDRHRIMLVATELGVGGAERCLTRLALGLDRDRFAPAVVSLQSPPAPERRELVRALDAGGVTTQFLGLDRWAGLPLAAWRLRSLFRQMRPDLVQSFLFHANVLVAWTRPRDTTHVGGIRVADPRRWRARVERRAARSMAAVACVSQRVADHCREHGFPAERLEVIPNGVEVERWAQAQPADLTQHAAIPPDAETVLFVGRLEPQKGLERLLKQWPTLVASRPKAHLILAGEGSQRLALQSLAASLRLEDRVHFLGWKPSPASLIRASRLLVLPSLWEGMPNAVLEAMACGRPVIATDVEGVEELLGPLSESQLVREPEPNFADAIATLLADEDASARLGKANQRRALEHFSVEAMTGRYALIYTRLLALRPLAMSGGKQAALAQKTRKNATR